ncbi:hypothetical protein SRHO_G00029640 [Serrasalmus rhombeus]
MTARGPGLEDCPENVRHTHAYTLGRHGDWRHQSRKCIRPSEGPQAQQWEERGVQGGFGRGGPPGAAEDSLLLVSANPCLSFGGAFTAGVPHVH